MNEHVPLGRRWFGLLAVRATCAGVTVGALRVLPGLAGEHDRLLGAISVVYLACVVGAELVRRSAGARWLGLLRGLIVADVVYLALVVNVTGGTESPLAFLPHLHIVAVTLVISHRGGLEAAVGHAGMVFLTSSTLGARYLDGLLWSAPSGAALRATSYLIVAVAAAALASVDERALIRSRGHVQAQLDLAAELHAAVHLQATTAALARHLVDRLGFRRAAVLGSGAAGGSAGAVYDPAGPVLVDRLPQAIDELVRGRPATALVAELEGPLDALLPNAENVVILSMEADGRPVGLLAAEWGPRRRARISADVVDATAQSAGNAALALRGAILLAASQRTAGRDDLTGLANRRVFREALDREVARVGRNGGVMALAILDLDHFKAVNDRHGHQAGDAVLRTAARTLATEARHGDLPARLGGDEFAILLPDCGPRHARAVVDRMVDAIGRELAPTGVTASAGVASFPDCRTAHRLLAAADAALYESKRNGRGRASGGADPVVIDLDERRVVEA
jgi:diguanylate cyclase (GGDEF)-like protein